MILVTGAKGQLGSDVCEILEKEKVPHIAADIGELDITKEDEVESFFEENEIDSVIHCAAYTAVDKAEDEKEKCFLVNETGTKNLSLSAAKRSAKILYVSTDYVFRGEGSVPFETSDPKGPLNVYGESKLAGERAVLENNKKSFVVRTSWVFGEKNTNFIATMLRLSKTHDEVNVVCDQIGSPTYSRHLARLICDIVKTDRFGVYHATNEGFCSWSELAEKAFSTAEKKTVVNPVTSSQYKTRAKRPLNSRLSKASLDEGGFERLPRWEDAVAEYLANPKID